MRESQYQNKLIKKLNELFPGCVIVKNDPRHIQGIPDILILFDDHWAGLEIKISPTASVQANQEYYVNRLNGMSFASFINPDNEEDVLSDLQHAFGIERSARIS
jgi:hypothetical protein